ncbi:hypothetical protein K439DRAFT_1622932 [Ramaria rubella]|nr:hypothetical protein K439DRAFT_1622932 [Ramaria rubella]
MATPSTMHALVVQEDKTVAVHDVPVPKLSENKVLIKVCVEVATAPGIIIGCGLSGIVVMLGGLGAPTINLKPGDHATGFVQDRHWNDCGAVTEYLKVDTDFVWVVPDGTVSHEEATTMGCWCQGKAMDCCTDTPTMKLTIKALTRLLDA